MQTKKRKIMIFGGRWDGLDLPPAPIEANVIHFKVGKLEDMAGNVGSLRLHPEVCESEAVLLRLDMERFYVGDFKRGTA